MFDGDLLSLRCLVVDDYRDGADAPGASVMILGLARARGIRWPRSDRSRTCFPAASGGARYQHARHGRIRNRQTIEAARVGSACGFCCTYPDATRSSKLRVFADFHHVLKKGDGPEA